MHAIIWQFEVAQDATADFERTYGPDGDWARLMRRGTGYLGTELLVDAAAGTRYVTIDRWDSRDAYAVFRREHSAEYDALDGRCASLTRSERSLGTFDVVSGGRAPSR